jgi:aspartate dehydrogenase
MNAREKKKIGIIGFGQIGSSLHREITQNPEMGFEVAFVYEIDNKLTEALPKEIVIQNMEDFPRKNPDLVVEAAHPDVVRQFGEFILSKTDFMIMSVTSMSDPDLQEKLKKTCLKYGTQLCIPHGATIGLDGLLDGRDIWEEVTITMRKNPKNLDFRWAAGTKPEEITQETVLYDGPTRGICSLYPRNVNSHATLALAVLGFDRTRSILIANPKLEEAIIEIDARGAGTEIHIKKGNPIKGVTGKLTILSVLETVKKILRDKQGIQIY